MTGTKQNSAGFTLLEVMVAVAILAISLTALFGAQSSGVSLAAETRFNTQAPLLAEMKLAELQAAGEVFSQDGDFGDAFPDFSWELEAEDAVFDQSDLLTDLDSKLQHLKLTIRWGEDEYSYQTESYLQGSNEDE